MTQAEIARAVGKSRSAVANFLRLLKLPPSVRKLLDAGALSMGHARALLAVDDPVRAGRLARAAAEQGWSVRQVERRVKEKPGSGGGPDRPPAAPGDGRAGSRKDPLVQALETALQQSLSTRVSIREKGEGRGSIEITYLGADDFERIFELVTGRSAAEVVQ
jgi:ParB family chromosome partitioning protein